MKDSALFSPERPSSLPSSSCSPRAVSPAGAHWRRPSRLCAAALCTVLIAGCQKQEQAAEPQLVRVRAQTVEFSDYTPALSLTGVIAAQTLNNLSFRVGGRVAERLVDVGQHVEKDMVLARLDPQAQESDFKAAEANLTAAQAQARQATAAFDRQKTLLAQGFTTRRDYDQAEQSLRTAQASVQASQSQLADARESLSFTELRAGAAGIVTARDVETGQVVQAAQTVFTVAEDGDRDAVFDVQESLVVNATEVPPVTITLISNPEIKATGQVREVSPVVSRAAVRVKVGIPKTPPAMQLGAAVTGTIRAHPHRAVMLPWQALASIDGKPAVWIIDPGTRQVAMTPVGIRAYSDGNLVIDKGLEQGQQVVTAGAQLLRPGQPVEIAEEAR